MKRIALLGATGSIGGQAIAVIERHPGLELCALASGSTDLAGLADAHGVEHVQTGGDLTGLLDATEPDIVLNAVVGFAGIGATLWALEHGVTLALANKESLVAAGELALRAQGRGGGLLLPVDSEHSAVFQCLEGRSRDTVDSIVLTASGGPFRGRSRDELEHVSVEEALTHPTWSMGPKITVDSATLANKGLELIEAHFLFGLPYGRIEVVVHPTSIVHALVRFRDGATIAHLGYPDMTVPISYALSYPERPATDVPRLDLAAGSRSSSPPRTSRRFRSSRSRARGRAGRHLSVCLQRRERGRGRGVPAGRLPFLGDLRHRRGRARRRRRLPARDLDDLVEADAEARRARREGSPVT